MVISDRRAVLFGVASNSVGVPKVLKQAINDLAHQFRNSYFIFSYVGLVRAVQGSFENILRNRHKGIRSSDGCPPCLSLEALEY